MISDCDSGIKWVISNIEKYNGDINNIFLSGQSAGANILMNSVLKNSVGEYSYLCHIKGIILTSGIYDITKLSKLFKEKGGLPKKIVQSIFKGDLIK